MKHLSAGSLCSKLHELIQSGNEHFNVSLHDIRIKSLLVFIYYHLVVPMVPEEVLVILEKVLVILEEVPVVLEEFLWVPVVCQEVQGSPKRF